MSTHFIFFLHTTISQFLVLHTRWSAPFLEDYYLYYPVQGVTDRHEGLPKEGFPDISLPHLPPTSPSVIVCLPTSFYSVCQFLQVWSMSPASYTSLNKLSPETYQWPQMPVFISTKNSTSEFLTHSACISFRLDLLFQSCFSLVINLSYRILVSPLSLSLSLHK